MDEINQLRNEIKWYRKWLENINIDGPVTEEDAEDMRRWARLALTQVPGTGWDETESATQPQINFCEFCGTALGTEEAS